MKNVILCAHGSKIQKSADEILKLTGELNGKIPHGSAVNFSAAFLQWAGPSIMECVRGLYSSGERDFIILPYLLSEGRHAGSDIESAADEIKKEFPDIRISIAPHIGAAAGMSGLIISHLEGLIVNE